MMKGEYYEEEEEEDNNIVTIHRCNSLCVRI